MLEAVDTHCHLDLIQKETGSSIPQLLEAALEAKVTQIMQIAVDLPSSKENGELVDRYKHHLSAGRLWYATGIHPLYVDATSPQELENIFKTVTDECIKDTGFWGMGETGLDYFHCKDADVQNLQKKCMRMHMEFAATYALPVVLHLRESKLYDPAQTKAIHDAWEICKHYPNVQGVLHCFAYTEKEAEPFVKQGWFVSYSGIITYKNTEPICLGLERLPLHALLVETDAPYLTPDKKRPKKNQPAFVQDTMQRLCEIRSDDPAEQEKIRAAVLKNAEKFFALRTAGSASVVSENPQTVHNPHTVHTQSTDSPQQV